MDEDQLTAEQSANNADNSVNSAAGGALHEPPSIYESPTRVDGVHAGSIESSPSSSAGSGIEDGSRSPGRPPRRKRKATTGLQPPRGLDKLSMPETLSPSIPNGLFSASSQASGNPPLSASAHGLSLSPLQIIEPRDHSFSRFAESNPASSLSFVSQDAMQNDPDSFRQQARNEDQEQRQEQLHNDSVPKEIDGEPGVEREMDLHDGDIVDDDINVNVESTNMDCAEIDAKRDDAAEQGPEQMKTAMQNDEVVSAHSEAPCPAEITLKNAEMSSASSFGTISAESAMSAEEGHMIDSLSTSKAEEDRHSNGQNQDQNQRHSQSHSQSADLSHGSNRGQNHIPDHQGNQIKSFFTAASCGNEEWLREILEANASASDHAPFSLDIRDEEGSPALVYAACFAHQRIIQLLIEFGAQVDITDKNGWTPLMWAMNNGHEQCVKTLLDSGASLTAKAKYGRTAKDFITMAANGNQRVTDILQSSLQHPLSLSPNSQHISGLGIFDEAEAIDEDADEDNGEFEWNKCLPDQMLVFNENSLPTLLDLAIQKVEKVRRNRHVPANVIFLSARFAHNFASQELLDLLLRSAFSLISSLVNMRSVDWTSLSFWLSNCCFLLCYLKKDHGLVVSTAVHQLTLAELIQDIYNSLVNGIRKQAVEILEICVFGHDPIPGSEAIVLESCVPKQEDNFGRAASPDRQKPLPPADAFALVSPTRSSALSSSSSPVAESKKRLPSTPASNAPTPIMSRVFSLVSTFRGTSSASATSPHTGAAVELGSPAGGGASFGGNSGNGASGSGVGPVSGRSLSDSFGFGLGSTNASGHGANQLGLEFSPSAPRNGNNATSPSMASAASQQLSPRAITSLFSQALSSLRTFDVPGPVVLQAFSQVYYFINARVFNTTLNVPEYCSRWRSLLVRMNLSVFEEWAIQHLEKKILQAHSTDTISSSMPLSSAAAVASSYHGDEDQGGRSRGAHSDTGSEQESFSARQQQQSRARSRIGNMQLPSRQLRPAIQLSQMLQVLSNLRSSAEYQDASASWDTLNANQILCALANYVYEVDEPRLGKEVQALVQAEANIARTKSTPIARDGEDREPTSDDLMERLDETYWMPFAIPREIPAISSHRHPITIPDHILEAI